MKHVIPLLLALILATPVIAGDPVGDPVPVAVQQDCPQIITQMERRTQVRTVYDTEEYQHPVQRTRMVQKTIEVPETYTEYETRTRQVPRQITEEIEVPVQYELRRVVEPCPCLPVTYAPAYETRRFERVELGCVAKAFLRAKARRAQWRADRQARRSTSVDVLVEAPRREYVDVLMEAPARMYVREGVGHGLAR